MAEKIIARQTFDGLWQWRSATVEGQWLSDVYHTGDNEAMAEQAKASHAAVTLLVPGESVVCCSSKVESKDKRHLAKMLPYELEEQIIDNVEDVHMVFGGIREDQVSIAYIKSDHLTAAIAPLLQQSCDLRVVVASYLSLRTENQGVTIVADNGQLIVRLGEDLGFTVDIALAPMVLRDQPELDFTVTINLVAEDDTQLDWIEEWLPKAWKEENGPEIKRNIGGIWDWIEPEAVNDELNLRSGIFSRQLPLKRWLESWKKPLIAIAAAYLIAVCVAFVEYQRAKAEQKHIVATINEVYKRAVPNGRPGDAEGRLEKLVKNMKGGTRASSNLMVLLAGVSENLRGGGSIFMSSFRYNSDEGELMLNIEADSFGDLENLRTGVEKKGFTAELMRVEAKGDKQSARMKVAEASE